MGLWNQAPRISAIGEANTIEELKDYVKKLSNIVAIMAKDLEYIVNGNIDSRNTREIGGYLVNLTSLESRNGVVGLSSEITGGDDLRIWAGNAERELAAFRVYESGFVVSTKFLLTSSETGFPRIELSSNGSLLSAYTTENNLLTIYASLGERPILEFIEGANGGMLANFGSDFSLISIAGTDLQISSGRDLKLFASNRITVSDWSKLFSNSDGESLQTALNNKADVPPVEFTDTIDLATVSEIVVWDGFIVGVN